MNLPSTHVRAKRKEGLTVSALDGEVLVYDPTTTRASCLNAFAAEVLVRCDGRRSPAEIARSLPFEDVDERVVEVALADLRKAALIEVEAEVDALALTGPSRRAFFRHLGIGTAIAVPVVTGIVLPCAAQTASAGLGDSCNTNPDGGDNCVEGQCLKASGNLNGNCDGGVNNCVCQ